MTKLIHGAGGGKGGGNSARVPVESKDSLRSKAFAKVLDLVSEGEIEGLIDGLKSVYLDGTPIQNADNSYNFTGVELVDRLGTQDQSSIPGFSAVEITSAVNVKATSSSSVVRQITNANADAVRVTIGIPQLTFQNPENGDLTGTEVRYAIDLQSNGGGFAPQIISQQWTSTGMTLVSAGRYSSADATTAGIRIYSYAGPDDGAVLEYKLVSSGIWLTAGVKFVAGQKQSLTAVAKSYFQTPTLPKGQWEARLLISGLPPDLTVAAERLLGADFETLNGKTTTRYQRSYRIELTGSPPWDIRLRRITADSTQVNLQNETWFDAYTEIIDAKLRYPNSALVGIKVDASQFQNIPTRGYLMKMLRVQVPSNYNPVTRVYTGSWNGTFQVAWTDNPAWCFYDLVTNDRYGLGDLVDAAQVDKWALYQIGRYCDELVPDGFGGTEPRFTCNMYLQTRAEAFKVLQDMASIFRGMVYWSTGTITAVQDAPSDPVALFSPANVIDGKFSYAGSSLKARHTVALVTWNDPDDLYRQKVEYVEDEAGLTRYGVQQTEVVAVGCTSRGQANRVGRWLLFSERMESETVQFAVGLDGVVVRPGHVIKVSDTNRAGARLGGRVRSATSSAILVDVPPSASIVGWTLYCTLADGAVESRVVSSLVGNTINVAPAFTSAPLAESIWILSSSTAEAQTFRVVAVTEDAETGNYAITALKHEPLKFAAVEQGLVLQPRDITLLNDVPAAPTGLVLTESLYTYQSAVLSKITVGWVGVTGVYYYVAEWRKDNGNWVRAETQTPELELLDTTPGLYEFKVYSRNPAGLLSGSPLVGSLNALGKTAPPADVTGFSSLMDPNIGATLLWNRGTELDIDGYEIREGATWGVSTLVAQVKGTTLKLGLLPSGTKTYLIKAVDTSGVYSLSAASTTITLVGSPAPAVSAAFAGENLVLTWNAVQGSLATDAYEIRFGASFAGGTSLGTIKGTSFRVKAQWSGSRTFWVAAIDLAGSTGTAGLTTATVNAPTAVTVTQEVIDNNVLLKWGDSTATLPVDFYELRRGATWSGATVIGRVSARFTAIFESNAGVFTYWLAGYDVAGNEGTPFSVVAQVSQPPDYSLQYNLDSTFNGTRTSFFSYEGNRVAPVNTTETWTTHFTSRSWNTPQDQINAGFPIFIQPAESTGSYEETIDYGTVLAATKISATLTYQVVAGAPTVTPTISVKKLIGDPWTDYAGQGSVFVTDFRYAKVKFDFATSGGGVGLVDVSGLNVRFDVKLRNDAGSLSVFPSQAATYSQTGTAITVTFTAHGRVTGQRVDLDFTSGTAADGEFVITSHTANTFTVTSAASATTSGNVTIDQNGTPTLFNVPFVDVQSITLSPGGTSAAIAVYNFVDVPNPTGFKILLFNTGGTRISGTVGWSAKGV